MTGKYSSQQRQAAVTALKANHEEPYISHQWEELVLQLSHDNDPRLREKMYREMDEILEKDPGFDIFRQF